ncbi:transmembrane protein Pmi isoform X2 [Lycorma delicatula]|uniref:transmembrane protein Pmi isoform X2 n=1 Tax=Lycorma delicatula TaxID=130591 RepID=UPI003F514EB2
MTLMSLKDDRELNPKDVAIIREVYDSENAHEAFGDELERALEAGCEIIIIEPSRLGDETARWISVGNCLHKTAALSGIATIVTGLVWPDKPFTYTPLGIVSFFCTGIYDISWQFDPCCQYQVNKKTDILAKLPVYSNLTSSSPVVLIRKSDFRRKLLHTCITLASTLFCVWKLYIVYNK